MREIPKNVSVWNFIGGFFLSFIYFACWFFCCGFFVFKGNVSLKLMFRIENSLASSRKCLRLDEMLFNILNVLNIIPG